MLWQQPKSPPSSCWDACGRAAAAPPPEMDYSDANSDMLTSTPRVRMMLSLKAGMVKAPKYWMPSPVKIWAPALNHTGSCERESHFQSKQGW